MQHLTAHVMSGHDAFVTSDEDDMLRKRDRLREVTGIVVLDPDEAVRLARRSGERAPLPGHIAH